MNLPRWIKPAIGGVMVGFIALAIPEVLGTGYGWIQQGLGHQLLTLPLWIVLILPFARILATGLSIGSGGSGGIFGPGLVIGAFIGASVWRLFEPIVPSMGHNPAPYVIIGMMCCFGGISRAPLAVMLMVAEMTGSLSLLGPAMIAVGLAWFIVRRSDDTIYRSQLKSGRCPSPAPPDGNARPGRGPGHSGHGTSSPGDYRGDDSSDRPSGNSCGTGSSGHRWLTERAGSKVPSRYVISTRRDRARSGDSHHWSMCQRPRRQCPRISMSPSMQ